MKISDYVANFSTRKRNAIQTFILVSIAAFAIAVPATSHHRGYEKCNREWEGYMHGINSVADTTHAQDDNQVINN